MRQVKVDQLRRACSAQFILDDGYENEFLKLKHDKILFTNNNFEVNYTGALVDVKNKYYKSPKLIWDAILLHKDKIQSKKPVIYEKIKKLNTMTLTDTFKI